MSFKSTGIFKCDGCKVIESDEIEVPTDIMQATIPPNWLRVELNKTTAPEEGREPIQLVGIKHYCPGCTKLVESYLNGRTVEEKDEAAEAHDDAERKLRRWHRKACVGLGLAGARSLIADLLAEMQKPDTQH